VPDLQEDSCLAYELFESAAAPGIHPLIPLS